MVDTFNLEKRGSIIDQRKKNKMKIIKSKTKQNTLKNFNNPSISIQFKYSIELTTSILISWY